VVDAGDGVIHVAGELDAATADRLAQRLAASSPVRVIELSAVTFIDASGLRVLLAAAGGIVDLRPQLRAPSRAVVRLLDLTGLTDVFTTVGDHRAG
jgi:anti-anti-sigma factor